MLNSSFVVFPDPGIEDNCSIIVRLKLDCELTGEMQIVSMQSGWDNILKLSVRGDRRFFFTVAYPDWNGRTTVKSDPLRADPDHWYTVVAAVDKSRMRLYVDGCLQGETAVAGARNLSKGSSQCWIGRWHRADQSRPCGFALSKVVILKDFIDESSFGALADVLNEKHAGRDTGCMVSCMWVLCCT
jgi:hypothetical protein